MLTGAIWYYASPANLQVGYAPEQPVPYSHRLHAGEMELDCRYCHANVERSHEAMIPPTQTCMGCHTQVHPESQRLAAVRESFETGESVEWVRVHQVPDHVFFDHSVHLAAGVGCVTCHGRVDQMEEVHQDQPLSMGWCLECHRNPEPNIRPVSEITNMAYDPTAHEGLGAELLAERGIAPKQNCSTCHR